MVAPKLRTLLLVPLAAMLLGNSDCQPTEETVYGAPSDEPELAPPGAEDEVEDGDEEERYCVPAERLTCGELTTADTSDWNDGATDVMDGYEISSGDYSGPEIVHIFTAVADEVVEWRLVDTDPSAVDHDVYVLDGNMECSSDEALAWGTDSVTFEAQAGRSYYLVVDGRDGGSGAYAASLECEGLVDPDPDPPTGGPCDGLIGLGASDPLAAVARCAVVEEPRTPADGIWAAGDPTYDILSTDLCIAQGHHNYNDEPYLVVSGTMETEATDGADTVWQTAFIDATGDTTASVTEDELVLTGWSAGIEVDENFQTMVTIVYDIDSETMSYVLETRPWGLGDPELQYSAVLDCEAY